MSCERASTSEGVVVWFTGAPSSGKSTLARALAERLKSLHARVVVLDGDDVRAALRPPLGYDAASREAFYETLSGLAALLARQQMIVLVAATAHRAVYRERARQLAPRFIEVWIDASESERRQRDSKGLYRSQAAGSLHDLPGSDLVYEAPQSPDWVASGGCDTAAIERLTQLLVPAAG
jgi:adenylylsulfate kinase